MAILKIKQLEERLAAGTQTVTGASATTADYATSAGRAGTARVAHYGSSGTGALSGTAASV